MLQGNPLPRLPHVDVFSAVGSALGRARNTQVGSLNVKVLGLEDLTCRLAWEMLRSAAAGKVLAKTRNDFLRAADAADRQRINAVWSDYRKPTDPHSFIDAIASILCFLNAERNEPAAEIFSRNIDEPCFHCESGTRFRLDTPARILEILDYC